MIEQGNVEVYNPFRAALAQLKEQNAGVTFDYEDQQGNELARSHVYRIRLIKADVESCRKEAKKGVLEEGRRIDAQAKAITAELEEMIAVHAVPLKKIDEREKQWDRDVAGVISSMSSNATDRDRDGMLLPSDVLHERYAEVAEVEMTDWFGKHLQEAVAVKATSMAKLERMIADAQDREANQVELERLRQPVVKAPDLPFEGPSQTRQTECEDSRTVAHACLVDNGIPELWAGAVVRLVADGNIKGMVLI